MTLIRSAGGVAPALRGVTAWLTCKDPDVFTEVLTLDPEVLLYSDLSTTTDHQRAALVDWLLEQAKLGNPLVHDWGMFWTYRKLKHAGMKSQLQSIIRESASVAQRFCAIQIADACNGAGLSTLLTDVALQEAEPLSLRIAAASCVADHGDEAEKARLLPLALEKSENDEQERLQAAALSAVWPTHCTWTQVRDSLGDTDPQTTTALGRFLGFEFAERLPVSDLSDALRWLARKNPPPNGLSGWATATDHLLVIASASADDASVRHAIVVVLLARLTSHHKTFNESITRRDGHVMRWSATARREIAAELFPKLASRNYLAVSALRSSSPLLDREDIKFMMGCWQAAGPDEKVVWQLAIAWLVDWQDTDASAAVLKTASEHDPHLTASLEAQQQFVFSGLESESRDRTGRELERQRRKEERIAQIHDLLNRVGTETGAFGYLLWTMSFPLDEDWGANHFRSIRGLPGWTVLSSDDRERLLAAGKLFLQSERPYSFRGLRRGQPTRNCAAGYCVLHDLAAREPLYIEGMSAHTWDTWIPAIVLVQADLTDNDYDAPDRKLLSVAAVKHRDRFMRTLGIALRRTGFYGAERLLGRVFDVVGGEVFLQGLSATVLRHRVPNRVYLSSMRRLLACSDPDAIKVVNAALPRVRAASTDELPRLALDAVLGIELSEGRAWAEAFEQFQTRPEFAPLLLDVPGKDGKAFGQIVTWLSDEQLGDAYLLFRNYFGSAPTFPVITNEPHWLAQGTILAELRQRRHATSLVTLKRIIAAYPNDWELQRSVWDAKRLFRETSWEPLATREIKRIVEDRRQLLVRDEQELLDAVWEALHDYQRQIRSEGSQVMRLWNEPVHTPKPEEPLSREIGNEIQRLLAPRGVKITHEVKIREKQHVDIYVSAFPANSTRRLISMIIEVKGCWHRELMRAMDTQLSMRYLKDNDSRFGIYLVVWFLCDQWDGRGDARKKDTMHQSLAEIRAFLDGQANAVNAQTQSVVRALVLDATIEGSGPKEGGTQNRRSRKTKKPRKSTGASTM